MTIKELKQKYPLLGALAESLIDPDYLDNRGREINEDLDCAFNWEETDQGEDFWDEVYNSQGLQEKEEALGIKDAVSESGEDPSPEPEANVIQITEDFWVVETDTFTYSQVISVEHLDDNQKMYIDIIQETVKGLIFARLPKSRFRGMYKRLKS